MVEEDGTNPHECPGKALICGEKVEIWKILAIFLFAGRIISTSACAYGFPPFIPGERCFDLS
jgi:uncharacterized protein (DUF433 family)